MSRWVSAVCNVLIIGVLCILIPGLRVLALEETPTPNWLLAILGVFGLFGLLIGLCRLFEKEPTIPTPTP